MASADPQQERLNGAQMAEVQKHLTAIMADINLRQTALQEARKVVEACSNAVVTTEQFVELASAIHAFMTAGAQSSSP